ncbi:zinc-ribbon-domain-containing protein [Sporodiniella umbellata]|nr:zinc-ribbon-domain-containing protein [Sporodiniella umbellata]
MSQGGNQARLNKGKENDEYSQSFHKDGILGCKHYQRKCKLQANCCQKIVSCRFCHDDAEDHAIVRHETKNMLCMLCLKLQPAGQDCAHCKEQMACYYCDKCKLWDDSKTSIYHCEDCGICRKGKGLGKDFFHCKKCNICMSIKMKTHKCIERNLECDCPICGEYLFTSTSVTVFMPCGHCIHKHCYAEYVQTSYQCPTCLKSLSDMSSYFNRLDKELERQPMPPEYENVISHIFCNDCETRTKAKHHFFYHKCGNCGSFNTTVLKTENTSEVEAAQRGESSTATLGLSSSNEALGLSENTEYLNQVTSSPGVNYERNPLAGPSSSRTDPDSNEG